MLIILELKKNFFNKLKKKKMSTMPDESQMTLHIIQTKISQYFQQRTAMGEAECSYSTQQQRHVMVSHITQPLYEGKTYTLLTFVVITSQVISSKGSSEKEMKNCFKKALSTVILTCTIILTQ